MQVRAPSFGVVLGEATCHACGVQTPVARIWVPEHTYTFDLGDEAEHEPDPAMLSFVSGLSSAVLSS